MTGPCPSGLPVLFPAGGLQPRQPSQRCPPKGSARWAHLGVLPAHPTSQPEPLPGTVSIGRMGCSAAWLAPLHPGPSARSLKSLPPDPAQEPLTLKGMKGADSSVNAPAARSLRSHLMTLEKKELDQHGELTRFPETAHHREAASQLPPVLPIS